MLYNVDLKQYVFFGDMRFNFRDQPEVCQLLKLMRYVAGVMILLWHCIGKQQDYKAKIFILCGFFVVNKLTFKTFLQ